MGVCGGVGVTHRRARGGHGSDLRAANGARLPRIMIDRIQNRVLKLAAKIAFSASLAGLLSLSFAFIHRSLLKLGGHPQRGSELSVWIQCEDVYGPILFSLLFLGAIQRAKGFRSKRKYIRAAKVPRRSIALSMRLPPP